MKKLVINLSVVALVGLLISCSEDDEPLNERPFIDPNTTEYYKGTQSPGDVWDWALDKDQQHMTASWDMGTFDDTSDDITVEGSYTVLPSGYMKVTISDVTPATEEIPADGSAWFYALEIPGMVMVVKPEGSIKGDLIALVAAGDCSDIEGVYNYVTLSPSTDESYDPVTDDSFGLATFTPSGNGFDISGYKYSLDCVYGDCTTSGAITGFPTATCDEKGSIVISEDVTVAEGQFTAGGAMMLDKGYGNGGVFAMKAANNTSKGLLNGNSYLGLAWTPMDKDQSTHPIKVNFTDNGDGLMVGDASVFTNVETGAVSENKAATLYIDSILEGKAEGVIEFLGQEGQATMIGAFGVNGDDQVMIISSYSLAENDPFVLILAKQ